MPTSASDDDNFSASRECFESVVGFLHGPDATGLTHGELEAKLTVDLRELVRQLFQDHLDLRAAREERHTDVVDASGTPRGRVIKES